MGHNTSARLRMAQCIAGRAVKCAQRYQVLGPKLCDDAIDRGRATRALAYLCRQLRADWRILWFSHQHQCLSDSLIRQKIQKRRLLQLRGQCLTERGVKHSIAGAVGKISQHNRIGHLDGTGVTEVTQGHQCDERYRSAAGDTCQQEPRSQDARWAALGVRGFADAVSRSRRWRGDDAGQSMLPDMHRHGELVAVAR